MRHNIFNIFLLTGLAVTACSKDDNIGQSDPRMLVKTLYCVQGDTCAATRTSLGTGDVTLWTADDKISVLYYYNDKGQNAECTLSRGAGTSRATFTGTFPPVADISYFAVYPYHKELQYSTSTSVKYIQVPPVQIATLGTFDPTAMVQISKPASDDILTFYNLGAMLEITAPFDCTSIMVETARAENLTGVVTGSFTGSAPTYEIESSLGSRTVVLAGNIKADSKYCICTLPFTASQGNGVKITYRNGAKAVTATVGKTAGFTVARAHIQPFSKSSKILPATDELVDLGLSVQWSTKNIGATTASEQGLLYSWGELGTKQQYASDNYLYTLTTKFYQSITQSDQQTIAPEYDIASVLSGTAMRMPTKAEWDELLNGDNCTWTWDDTNKGYTVTSKKTGYTDKSIFLPATGNNAASYWSGTLMGTETTDKASQQAYSLYISRSEYSSEEGTTTYTYTHYLTQNARYSGFFIRPVAKP